MWSIVCIKCKAYAGGGVVCNRFAFQEYHDNIGDLDGPEEKERAQVRTKEIIDAL